MVVGKTFLSFLDEAPEDIIAVRDQEGRDRPIRQLAKKVAKEKLATPKPRTRNSPQDIGLPDKPRSEAPVKVSKVAPSIRRDFEQDLDDKEAKQGELNQNLASRTIERNPELQSIFRANPFIRDRFLDNQGFADEFANNEEFREYFRELDGTNTPKGGSEVRAKADKRIDQLNDRIRAINSGREVVKSNTYNDLPRGQVYDRETRQYLKATSKDDAFVKQLTAQLTRAGEQLGRPREFNPDGTAKFFDDENRSFTDTGREFDLNDEDVFDNYYKSIRRIMASGGDPLELMSGVLEQKKGEVYGPNNESKHYSDNFIHNIPDEYDLSDPEIVDILSSFNNSYHIFDPEERPDEDEDYAFERKWFKDTFANFDLSNDVHKKFLSSLKKGDKSDPADLLWELSHEANFEYPESSENPKDYPQAPRWTNDHIKKFLDRHVNEDNAESLGGLLTYLQGEGDSVHMPLAKSMREYLETDDISKLSHLDDFDDEDLHQPGVTIPDNLSTNHDAPAGQGYSDFLSSVYENFLEGEKQRGQASPDLDKIYNFGDDEMLNDTSTSENNERRAYEVAKHLNGSLYGFASRGLIGGGWTGNLADVVTEDDDRIEGVRRAMANTLRGEDEYAKEIGEGFYDIDEMSDFMHDISYNVSESNLENDGSNRFYGDYIEDDYLIPDSDLDAIFNVDNNPTIEEMGNDFDRQMSRAIDDARERDLVAEREITDENIGEGGSHPRLLWGADTPEESPRRAAKDPIARARDAALGRIERGAADAAEKARENVPDNVAADPRAQAAYNRLRNLNLRGDSEYTENDDGIPISKYDKDYDSDFTSFGLEFFDNPNQHDTHLIPTLDADLERAGLERGDLRRAVYIAWSAQPNRAEALKRFKDRNGRDADPESDEFKKFAKRIAALNAKENWKQNVLPDLQTGDVLYNTPIGGADGERALLYQMMGFGKAGGGTGQQAVVGPDGKVYPLNPPGPASLGRHREARQAAVRNRRQAAANAAAPTPPGADGTPQRPTPPAPQQQPEEGSPEERGFVRDPSSGAMIYRGNTQTPDPQEPAPDTPTRSFPDVEELISNADLGTTQGAQAAAEALGRLIGGDDEAVDRARNAFNRWWLSSSGGRGGPSANWLRDYAHRTRPVEPPNNAEVDQSVDMSQPEPDDDFRSRMRDQFRGAANMAVDGRQNQPNRRATSREQPYIRHLMRQRDEDSSFLWNVPQEIRDSDEFRSALRNETIRYLRSPEFRRSGGTHEEVTYVITRLFSDWFDSPEMQNSTLRSLQTESYITEEMNDSGFFSLMFPDLDDEEIQEILDMLDELPPEQEREPDMIDFARDHALDKLKRKAKKGKRGARRNSR